MLAALLALPSLAGCASGNGGPTPEPAHAPAETVIVVRGGGLAGGSTTWRVAAGAVPPSNISRADARRVLRIAGSPAFRSMQGLTVPAGLCCDRFLYDITVHYADGSVRHFKTADGLDRPVPLGQLLEAIH